MGSPPQPPSMLKSTLAGGVGGACLVVTGQPLDIIKVRIQTMTVIPGQPPPYRGTFHCFSQIVKNEGIRGLYKGMGAPLVGVTPMYSMCFLGYSIGKKIFTTPKTFDDLAPRDLAHIAAAGAVSGIFTTPILAPLERIKCVLQVQGSGGKFKGPVDCAKSLFAEGGLASVNRGFCATLLRDSIASAFYFSSYEVLKRWFRREDGTVSVAGTLTAGGVAGMLNWLFAVPVDTLKSRVQVAPEGHYRHGIRSAFAEVVAKDGIWSLYRGITPIMIRAFPANAACFLGYETAIKVMTKMGIQ